MAVASIAKARCARRTSLSPRYRSLLVSTRFVYRLVVKVRGRSMLILADDRRILLAHVTALLKSDSQHFVGRSNG